jgi:hypothetical protein
MKSKLLFKNPNFRKSGTTFLEKKRLKKEETYEEYIRLQAQKKVRKDELKDDSLKKELVTINNKLSMSIYQKEVIRRRN